MPVALFFAVMDENGYLIVPVANAAALLISVGTLFALKKKTPSKFVGLWMLLGINLIGPIALNAIELIHGWAPPTQIDIATLLVINSPPMFWFLAGDAGVPSLLLVTLVFFCVGLWEVCRSLLRKA